MIDVKKNEAKVMGEIKIFWPSENVFVHFYPKHLLLHWQFDNTLNLHPLINSAVTLSPLPTLFATCKVCWQADDNKM